MPRKLLIADDDEAACTMLEKFLEKHGYQVTSVPDGEIAVAALKPDAGFDAVILDVMMPRLSGHQVLKHARSIGLTMPIIMATAVSTPEDIVAALNAGADDYVTKPYSFPVLLARLEARMRVRLPSRPPLPPRPRPPPPKPDDDGLLARLTGYFKKPPPPPPVELKPGTWLQERYQVEGPLGAGAFGTVYQARHVDLQQAVAVKVLTRRGPHGTIAALKKEAQSACRVRHVNAVRVFDFGLLPPSSAFLVMELLDGNPLDVALRDGPLTPEVGLGIVRGLLGALAVMHRQGLVHRDVKPANVLMHHEAGRTVPKLIDFGTARAIDDPDDEGGALMGSLAYICPERIRGEAYDGRADVYSCGVMLYKLLTGALPVAGDPLDPDNVARWHLSGALQPPSALRAGLPGAVDELVVRLLAKAPAARPTADEAESLVDEAAWG